MNYEEIISTLKARVAKTKKLADEGSVGNKPNPVVSEKQWLETEEELGLQLPKLMKTLFTQFANGGLGPCSGLLSAIDDQYQEYRDEDEFYLTAKYRVVTATGLEQEPSWRWPAKVLPIIDQGCGDLLCIDCDDSFRIVFFSGESLDLPASEIEKSAFQYTDQHFDQMMINWIYQSVEERPPLHLPFRSGKVPNYFGGK